jgi:hypothetical protein
MAQVQKHAHARLFFVLTDNVCLDPNRRSDDMCQSGCIACEDGSAVLVEIVE